MDAATIGILFVIGAIILAFIAMAVAMAHKDA
jgi:hypothetical protein